MFTAVGPPHSLKRSAMKVVTLELTCTSDILDVCGWGKFVLAAGYLANAGWLPLTLHTTNLSLTGTAVTLNSRPCRTALLCPARLHCSYCRRRKDSHFVFHSSPSWKHYSAKLTLRIYHCLSHYSFLCIAWFHWFSRATSNNRSLRHRVEMP